MDETEDGVISIRRTPAAEVRAPAPTGKSRAGAARRDLPWIRCIPLGGCGPFMGAHVRMARERDSVPLCVRALVLEDPSGARVALIATDLHGGSRYVTELVASALADEGFHVGNVFLSATHNHAAPGGLYGSRYYDAFGASTEVMKMRKLWSRVALNRELAALIARRIERCVRDAVDALEVAKLGEGVAYYPWSVNRSAVAFDRNFATPGERAQKMVAAGLRPAAELEVVSGEQRCVDGYVRTIAAFDASGAAIGSLTTVAAHCFVRHRMWNEQSPDFFGHAAAALEKEPARGIVGLAAGAIGDADPRAPGVELKAFLAERQHYASNMAQVDEHAAALASAVRSSLGAARRNAQPLTRLTTRFSEERIADQVLANGKKTAKLPAIGLATVAGTELGTGGFKVGPVPLFEPQESDGVDPNPTPGDPHGVKRRNSVGIRSSLHAWLQRTGYRTSLNAAGPALESQYDRLGLRLVHLERAGGGPVSLLGVPGEPTTWLTEELKLAVRKALPGTVPLVVGVTGDYQGYFTTCAEYDAQQYEGASTIWGRETATWLSEQVHALARQSNASTPPPQGSADFDTACEEPTSTRLRAEGGADGRWMLAKE